MKLTPERLSAFLAALSETCNVGRACRAVDISRYTAYKWRKSDQEFAEAWDEAMRVGVIALEDEAHRRAMEGTEEPVFHSGQQCGTIRKYSDTLAIFLLKAHNPTKYRDNQRLELTGADGGPVQVDDTQAAARLAALLAGAAAREDEPTDEAQ